MIPCGPQTFPGSSTSVTPTGANERDFSHQLSPWVISRPQVVLTQSQHLLNRTAVRAFLKTSSYPEDKAHKRSKKNYVEDPAEAWL